MSFWSCRSSTFTFAGTMSPTETGDPVGTLPRRATTSMRSLCCWVTARNTAAATRAARTMTIQAPETLWPAFLGAELLWRYWPGSPVSDIYEDVLMRIERGSERLSGPLALYHHTGNLSFTTS